MARLEFIKQMKELGYAIEVISDDRIGFHFVPRLGRFRGQRLDMGFVVNDDFPANCPGGPHIKPRLLPLNPEGADQADPRQPGEAPLLRPDELLQSAAGGASLAFDALTILADGFSGPDGRRARMQFDKLAEMAYQLHETLANTRIEVND